jgi:DNA sulfur modification protein DndE
MEIHAQKHLSDEEFFPDYVKAHIDRGILLLDQEARYCEDLLIHLTELEKGI